MATVDRMNTVTTDWVPGDAATGHKQRLIVDWTDNLFPQEFPIYTKLKGKGRKQVDQLKVEWGAGAELYHTLELEGSVANTSSDTLVTFVTDQGGRLQVNDTLAVYELDAAGVPDITTQENWRVKEITGDQALVGRAQSGTSSRSFSDGAHVVNLGTSVTEGADFTISPYAFGDFLYNYTELTQKGSRITYEANEIPNWEFENGDHIARLMTENARHAKRNVEDKIFRGKRAAGDIANDIPSTMGGFPTFIPSDNRVNLSGYPVSPYDIESIGATLWDSVGDAAAKTLIMSMRTARMFDGIMQKYRQADMNDTSMNLQFKSFSTRFGEFQIVHTRTCPDGVIYGVNFNNLSLHAFKGMDWTEMEHTGVNGAYKWRSIFGRFTLVARSPETMFEIYGFSNDLTNYSRSA